MDILVGIKTSHGLDGPGIKSPRWGGISNSITLAEVGEHWLENYFQFLFKINLERILIAFNIPGTGPVPESTSHYVTTHLLKTCSM
jgi:hypothetical protein